MPSDSESRDTASVSDTSAVSDANGGIRRDTGGHDTVGDDTGGHDTVGDDTGGHDTAGDDTGDHDTAGDEVIAWGPVTHDRIRSVIVGVGLAVVLTGVAVGVTVGVAIAAPLARGVAATLGGRSSGRVVPIPTGIGLGEAFVAVAFLLVITLLTVPYLYLWYDEWGRSGESVAERLPGYSSLRPGWLLLGAAVPVSLWAVGFGLTAFSPRLLFGLVVIAPLMLVWEGAELEVDPRAHAVKRTYPARDRSRIDDLNAVVRTRRIDVPRAGTVFLLAYRGNEWYRSTPWLTVPRDRADAVEEALDGVLARSEGPTRASVPERALLALMGSTTLLLGLAMSAVGEGGAALALGVLSAPFSVILLALAARL